jgi:AcrR family transcriptional regulator
VAEPPREEVEEVDRPEQPGAAGPGRQTRRDRPPITRELIVRQALRLLDRDGLDQLSMRRLAEELDTGAASLYWHVGSKDALLDLVLDEIIGEQEVPQPEPGRWQEQLKEIGRAARTTILRHRDVVRLSIGRIPTGPNALRYSERVLAVLRAAGVPDRLAVTGHHLLIAVVNGFTLDEVDGAAGKDGAGAFQQEAAMVRNFMASLPVEEFPNLVAVADHYAFADNDERFELLLDLYVQGLAKRDAEWRGRPAPERPADD